MKRVLKEIGVFILILAFVIFVSSIDSIIDLLLKIASYTYGPLLGLFAFGILTKRSIKDNWAFLPCFIAPLLCLLLDYLQPSFFGSDPTSFRIGQELLIINGLFTFLGLFLISSPNSEKK